MFSWLVVYLLIPTSNHNRNSVFLMMRKLYIFWFLHQTTTVSVRSGKPLALYIFWFLHQTTTSFPQFIAGTCCISFDSYIKPQLHARGGIGNEVVYLLIPTSNHNSPTQTSLPWKLYIFWFLHQTTTFGRRVGLAELLYIFWFLHQTTTLFPFSINPCLLYIFWFLHQTTTSNSLLIRRKRCISFDSYIKPQLQEVSREICASCISFDSYIKPQLWNLANEKYWSCISFDSYIKPQLGYINTDLDTVVYLLIPTSNHNSRGVARIVTIVVYLLIPTSNHNRLGLNNL